jgi:hypothetical protein
MVLVLLEVEWLAFPLLHLLCPLPVFQLLEGWS